MRGSAAQTSFWFLSSLQHRLKYGDNCRIYDEQARTEKEVDNAYLKLLSQNLSEGSEENHDTIRVVGIPCEFLTSSSSSGRRKVPNILLIWNITSLFSRKEHGNTAMKHFVRRFG
jgi:hypothetical protein